MADERPVLMMVEDDIGLQKQMRWSFDDYNVLFAQDRESALALLRRHEPKVVTLDLGLPPDPDGTSEGFATLEQIVALAPGTKVIVLTGQNDRSNALKAIGAGAYDFFAKPFEAETLGLIIGRAFRLADLEAENRLLLARQAGDTPLDGLLTRDPTMQKLSRQVERLAPTNATVLLHGESGTGKEVFARALHQLSPRRDKRFVAINCAAIPEALLESELFGHEKGAFTGAVKQTQGKIEVADGGTLFLDEIGELPKAMQAKLLRFLESGEIRRVGENESLHCDVRVVCATNRNLEEMVVSDEFREDLWFRVNTFEIPLPPLRERPDDIPRLARHLAGRFRKVPPDADIFAKDALAALSEHDWPGNVRELVNVIEHAMILCDDLPITPEHLPSRLTLRRPRSIAGAVRVADHSTKSLREIEMDAIFEALERCGGNKPKAAEQLGVSLKTLYNKLNQVSGLEKSA